MAASTSGAASVFDVALVPPGSGGELRLRLQVALDGVHLFQPDGQVFETFPYSAIIKWLPAESRTHNPGAADCLDIQVQTTQGLKDLRMRAISGTAGVDEILGSLKRTTEAIMSQQATGADVGAARYQVHLQGQPSLAGTPVKLSDLRKPFGVASAFSSPIRSMDSPPNFTPARSPGMHGAATGRMVSPVGPVRQAGRFRPDADIGAPPSRRRVDIGTLPFPGSNQQDGAAEGKSNQKFLEDMVRRLSEELSKLQSSDKPAPDSRSVASATPPAFLEGLAEGAPLPLWLSDAKYMSPLLVIYDKQLREQERVIKEGSAAMSELQATIAEVTTENERLLAEVTRQMELLAKHASAQGPDNGDAGGETLERLDLLTQENQLLTQQQSELETEIARLTGRMEERTRDHIKMAQESSQLGAKLRAAQTRLAEAEGRAERYRTAARHEGERADPLHQRSGREQGGVSVLNDVDNDVGAMRRSLSEEQALEHQLAAASAETSSLRQQLMEVLGSNNVLQTQVANLQEQHAIAVANASAAVEEAEELKIALSSMDARLAEFQRKDVEVYSRIKEAMESSEAARLANEYLHGRDVVLSKENASLREKLTRLRHELEGRFESESEVRQSQLRAELDVKRAELEEAKMKEAELRASLARAGRDMESLRKEKSEALTALESVPAGERSLGGGAATLATLERLKAMQEKLDRAEHAAADAVHRMEDHAKSAELERQGLRAEVVGLVKHVGSLEGEMAKLRGDLYKAQLAAEVAEREEIEGRHQRLKVETELRAALDSVSRDRSIAVKRLTGQVEDSTALLVRTREEHKVALAAYESQLTRWRDEAGHLAQKLKTIQAEHADDIERVKAAWAAKLEESGRAKPQEGDRGKEAAEDTEKDALAHQLADLLEVEAELVAERAQLRAELDRALLEKARAERAKNASQLRAAALQRQCDSLQDAALKRSGWDGATKADSGKLGHAHRPRSSQRQRGRQQLE